MPLARHYLTVMWMKPKNLSKAREHVKHWQYFDAINDLFVEFSRVSHFTFVRDGDNEGDENRSRIIFRGVELWNDTWVAWHRKWASSSLCRVCVNNKQNCMSESKRLKKTGSIRRDIVCVSLCYSFFGIIAKLPYLLMDWIIVFFLMMLPIYLNFVGW